MQARAESEGEGDDDMGGFQMPGGEGGMFGGAGGGGGGMPGMAGMEQLFSDPEVLTLLQVGFDVWVQNVM